MRKFECKGCENHCVVTLKETCFHPKFCPFANGFEPVWHEVKETTTNSSQLPDWVEECAVGYDNEQQRYFEVTDVSVKWVDIEYLDDGIGATCDYSDMQNCSEGRKRPFNAEEMRGLLGKVIVDGDNALFVSIYYGKEKHITAGCLIDFDGDDLMRCSCDGKPCYKLEHLENGEWVE